MDNKKIASELIKLAKELIGDSIYFDISDYERSHGKKPKGRGSWGFSIDKKGDNPIFSPSMTYEDAKKWAKNNENLGKKSDIIYVLS